jgi:hypothetical protein
VAGVRGARQAAERAARERLAGTLIGAAGELEVAVAQRAAAAGVIAARERAAAHVRRAQAEAERMVADAAAEVAVAEERYDRAQQAATEAGCSSAALADLGYPPPARMRSLGGRGRKGIRRTELSPRRSGGVTRRIRRWRHSTNDRPPRVGPAVHPYPC